VTVRRSARACPTLLLSLAPFAAGCSREAPNEPPPAAAASPVPAIEAWRARHEADYRRDYVTIAGLFPLKQGANTAGSAAGNDIVLPSSVAARIGTFVLTGKAVRFEPAPGASVRIKDQPLTAPRDLRDDSVPGPDELTVGAVRLVVHVSGEERTLRVRDPEGPQAKGFLGFAWFPIDLAYRVTGRFVRDPQPAQLSVVNTYGDVDRFTTEGVVEFTLLVRVQGRLERRGNLRGGALSLRRSRR
jgi:uncharacterized protein (DUF1684 family)